MSQERTPELEIVFDPYNANTHHPAMSTQTDIAVKGDDGQPIIKKIDVWRKSLRIVVKNTGTFAAKTVKVFAKVIIPGQDDASSGSDNFLRYPSDDTKLLYILVDGINVGEETPIPIVIADSDYKDCPIVEAPKRTASLATTNALTKLARNGLRVEDSFHPGDYLIKVTVTSEATSINTGVSVHVDMDATHTIITKVGPVAELSLPFDARSRKRSRSRSTKKEE